jgi:hypothetical protein
MDCCIHFLIKSTCIHMSILIYFLLLFFGEINVYSYSYLYNHVLRIWWLILIGFWIYFRWIIKIVKAYSSKLQTYHILTYLSFFDKISLHILLNSFCLCLLTELISVVFFTKQFMHIVHFILQNSFLTFYAFYFILFGHLNSF